MEKDRRGGKTILKSGHEWILPAQSGQLRQNKMERGGYEVICGTPTTLQCYGID